MASVYRELTVNAELGSLIDALHTKSQGKTCLAYKLDMEVFISGQDELKQACLRISL